MQTATEGCPSPQPSEGDERISVIESAAQALSSLAVIAPGLSEAELRVALYLATIQDPHHHSAQASSRQIAEATRVARANVQRALDSLARRLLIATRPGSATAAAAYRLNFTQTTALGGGLTARPPLQPELPGVASQQGHPSAPPPALDIDIDDSTILDRVLTARPQHFQGSELATVRSYAYKWLSLQRGQTNAHPPDDQTAAQLATAAGSVSNAIAFVLDNLQDRQATNCQYLVSMALQKIHGIAPPVVKRRRAQLRVVSRTQPAAPDQDPDFTQQTFETIGAIAKQKAIR